jgi:hypothetical protein
VLQWVLLLLLLLLLLPLQQLITSAHMQDACSRRYMLLQDWLKAAETLVPGQPNKQHKHGIMGARSSPIRTWVTHLLRTSAVDRDCAATSAKHISIYLPSVTVFPARLLLANVVMCQHKQ